MVSFLHNLKEPWKRRLGMENACKEGYSESPLLTFIFKKAKKKKYRNLRGRPTVEHEVCVVARSGQGSIEENTVREFLLISQQARNQNPDGSSPLNFLAHDSGSQIKAQLLVRQKETRLPVALLPRI